MLLFAVLRVVAAVFITETNRVMEHDEDLHVIKANREMAYFKKTFQEVVHKIDLDEDGFLNWDELALLLKDHRMTAVLPMIGFDENDLLKLFWLIDNGSGMVSISEFFVKMCKLKGPSKKINELAVLKIAYKIHQRLEQVWLKQGLIEKDIVMAAHAAALDI